MSGTEIQVDWSEIPDDILLRIAQTLTIYSDYIRLRAVCHNWRTSLPSTPPNTLPCQLPWLLLPPPTSIIPHFIVPATVSNSRRTFYNILTNKLHAFSVPESSYPRRILGSSHGYLILTSGTPEVFCLNFLTKSKVFLPPLSAHPGVVSFDLSNVGREYLIQDQLTRQVYPLELKQMRDDFIRKVVLSSPPTSNGSPSFAFAVTTSFLNKTTELVFCTISEDHWVWVPVSDFSAEDVIYCESKGLFYAVNHVGDVGSFRVGVGGVCDVTIWRAVSRVPCDLRYLVLFDGELMLLTRHLEMEVDISTYCELYRTVGFEVYRFCDYGPGQVCWESVKSLGDGVIFVGESASLALSGSDYPGCKANCVYFTDDHCKSNDVGVFNLEEKRTDALPCFPDDVILPSYWGSPIWITPNPH